MKKYKELVQENIKKYDELIKYCTTNNRAFPINWCMIMKLIEIDKLPKRHRHHYHSLVLGYYHSFNVKQKIERFHKQIKYGIFWSHNPKVYENLKKYLMNLKRDEWSYKWLDDYRNDDDISPYYPKLRLKG